MRKLGRWYHSNGGVDPDQCGVTVSWRRQPGHSGLGFGNRKGWPQRSGRNAFAPVLATPLHGSIGIMSPDWVDADGGHPMSPPSDYYDFGHPELKWQSEMRSAPDGAVEAFCNEADRLAVEAGWTLTEEE